MSKQSLDTSVTGSLVRQHAQPLPPYLGDRAVCQVTGHHFQPGEVVCITETGEVVCANTYKGKEELKGNFFSFQPKGDAAAVPAQ